MTLNGLDISNRPSVLKMGQIKLSRNVGNYHSTLLNVPEERRSQTQPTAIPDTSSMQSLSQCGSPAYAGITSRSVPGDADDGRGYQLPAYCHIPLLPQLSHVKQPKVLVAVPKQHYVAIGINIHLSKTNRLPPGYTNLSQIIMTQQ